MTNCVEVSGIITDVRQRWMPSGEISVIASLQSQRPDAGADRRNAESTQPLPLRATGDLARQVVACESQAVRVSGYLRRRYYRREGEPHWGQVEIWLDRCQPQQAEANDAIDNRI
ncbi:MAG: hypothetical protein Q9M26_07955 [Mariprofundales bacterium]|nr:hypothetical protein [Mariprofundales bacterium]